MALVPYDPKRVSHGTLPFAFVPDSRDEEKWEVLAAGGGLKRKDDEQRQLAEIKKLKKEKEVLEKEKEALEAFYLRQLAEQQRLFEERKEVFVAPSSSMCADGARPR